MSVLIPHMDVQALRATRTRAKVVQLHKTDLLRDLMYDSFGRKMGVFRDYRYSEVRRYYISNQSEWGRRHGVRRYRTRADPLERLVVAAIVAMLSDRERLRAMLLRLGIHDKTLNRLTAAGAVVGRWFDKVSIRQSQRALKALVERIELSSTLIKIVIRTPELPRYLSWDGLGFFKGDTDAWGRPHITDVIDVPANSICMKRELTLLLKRTNADASAKPNRGLTGLLKRARLAQATLDEREVYHPNELAARIHCHPKRFTHLVRLNYLAPDIIASILDGTQPPALNAKTIMAADLPMVSPPR